jgi:hypothetical protein
VDKQRIHMSIALIAMRFFDPSQMCDNVIIEDAMVGDDEISEAGRKARFARWEELGLDVIRTDLEATGGLRMVGGPPAVRKLAWEWVRMKEAERAKSADGSMSLDELARPAQPQASLGDPVSGSISDDLVAAASSRRHVQTLPSTPRPHQQGEILTLKPGIWGMSVDLKELGRRILNWWHSS